MTTPSIAHGLEGEWERLSLEGRPVLFNHERLSALLRVHIGQDAGLLLAKPDLDDQGHPLAWRSPRSGALQPVPPGPSEIRSRFEKKRAEILALAEKLSHQGEAGEDAARSLRAAVTTPTGVDGLFSDGGEPVLVYWGLIRPGQVVDEAPSSVADGAPATAAPTTTGPANTGLDASKSASSLAGATSVDDETRDDAPKAADPDGLRASRTVPWIPAVLCLLLLGVALWLLTRALVPLEPVVVDVREEVPAEGESLDGPLSDLEAQLAGLDQSIAEARLVEDAARKACVNPPREPEPPVRDSEAVPVTPPTPTPTAPPQVESAIQDATPVTPTPPVPEVKPTPPKALEVPKAVVLSAPSPPTPSVTPSACEPTWTPGREPRMIFVVDGSGSMRDGISGAPSRLDAAKRSIRDTVDALHPDIKAGLVSFSDCADTRNTEYYAYSQRPALMSKVDGMRPGQATSLAASIRRAGLLATRRSETVIMVLSDGEDTCGGDPCAAARQVKAEKPKAIIHVVDLSGGGNAVARCIADAGGGRVFAPNTAAQITQQLRDATGQPDTRACR